MSIPNSLDRLDIQKFKESTVTANQPGIVVVNPDGSNVGASVTVSSDTEFPAAAILADATANPTTTIGASALEVFNGTTWDRARGDITNGLDVDVTRVSGNVTVIQTTASSLNMTEANSTAVKTAVELIDDTVYTDGTGTPSKGVAVMGTDGTNPQIISTNTTGHVNITDGGNVISVDDNGGSLTVDSTQLPTALVGGRLDVVVGAALPAGANKIGAVDTDADATIGAAVPTIGLAVSGTDGTNSRLLKTDTSGELQVDVLTMPSITANLAGDDADLDSGAGTDNHDVIAIGVAASGGHAVITGDVANGLDVDVTRVSGTVTVDSELPAAAALADATTNPTTTTVGSLPHVFNGTTWDRVRGDTTNGIDVDVTRLSALVAGSAKIGAVDLDSDATTGSAVPSVGQLVVGTDGTNARALKTDTSGELQVDVLTMPAITVDSEFPSAAAVTDDFANPTTTNVMSMTMAFDGTSWDRVRGTSAEGLDVDITRPIASRAASGALGALNNAVTISGEGAGDIHWEIDTGTLVGTVVSEATLDDTNYFSVNVVENDGTLSSSFTAFNKRGLFVTSGYSQVRLRVSAYTSGTSNARLEASAGGASVSRVVNGSGAAAVNIQDGGNSITVDGTVTANAGTGTFVVGDGSGTLTVDAPVGTPVAARLSDGTAFLTTTSGRLSVDASGVAVPVTDNAGSLTVDNAALSVVGGGVEATALRVTLASDSTGLVSVDDNGGSITVDGTVTANAGTGTFTVDSELPAAAALADATANPTTPLVGSALELFNGTTWDRARGDTTNGLDVDVTRMSALVAGSAKIGAVDLDSDATIAAAVPTVAQFVAGTDGTNARALKTDASGELQVDVLTMPSVTVDSEFPTAAALTDNFANPTTTNVASMLMGFDGTTWDRVANGGGTEAAALRVTVASDSTGVLSVDDNAGSLTVDNAALSVVGGGAEATALRVTLANDSTGLVSVDDNAGSLTVDSAQLPASLVSGRLDVVVGAALPAGSNNIGDVDILTTVNPANRTASGALGALNNAVTVNSEGTGSVHFEIDTGTLVGTVVFEATLDDTNYFAINAIRVNGTIISSTTSFADRGALDSGGYSQVRLRVSAYTSGTSNARLEASAGASLVRLSQAIPAGTNSIGILGSNSGVDIGDVTINNASGASAVNIQDGGNSITIDGTVTANAGTGTFTVDSELPAAAVLADATANPTTPLVGSALEIFNGTTWDRARGDITNGLDVDVTRVSGTVTVDSELPAAAALADAASAAPSTPTVGSVPLLMNATTVDRQRAVVNSLDSVGTGIAASGLVGQFDDTAPSAVTENQFSTVRISSRRTLYSTPDGYAIDDSAMPATPNTMPVSGEYRSTATTYTDGDVTVLQTNVRGAVKVDLDTRLDVDNDSVSTRPTQPSNTNTTALTASLVIKSTSGRLIELRGYNSKATSQYIQIHDASALPADASVPEDVIVAQALSNFSITFDSWKNYGLGIVVSNSSTIATKTIGSADCWFSAEYI